MVHELLIAVGILGGMGLLFGALLAIAAKVFEVKQDARIPLVRNELPGANCGGCGFPGCDALAEAIVTGKAPINACPVGGAAVAEKIAQIMGQNAEPSGKRCVAFVMCGGDCDKAQIRSEYEGILNCEQANLVSGGPKGCQYGCLGYGNCVAACQFGALKMGEKGLPIVDDQACVACGACVKACPKHLITLIPEDQKIIVKCHSNEKGKNVRSNCSVGCIGCGLCQKVCESEAITVENNLACIDPQKCIQCRKCLEKCPTGAIIDRFPSEEVNE